jgi:hypothetical protein
VLLQLNDNAAAQALQLLLMLNCCRGRTAAKDALVLLLLTLS